MTVAHHNRPIYHFKSTNRSTSYQTVDEVREQILLDDDHNDPQFSSIFEKTIRLFNTLEPIRTDHKFANPSLLMCHNVERDQQVCN